VLAQAGLGIQIVPVSTCAPGQAQRVIAQQPPAGQAVPAGSEVTVLVGTSRPSQLVAARRIAGCLNEFTGARFAV
jgi:beta-lactam-binding protein with PASTA domain